MQQAISTCYAKWYNRIDKCKTCPVKIKNYCRDARNPRLLTEEGKENTVNYDDVAYSADIASHAPETDFDIPHNTEELLYSKKDLLELLSFMCTLDERTLELLDEKLQDPDINISTIARKNKLSRQSVHQLIQRRCADIPELEPILRNRKRKIENNKQPTFQEAVCQIRKQTQEQKLKKQRIVLKSLNRLTCLNQSLDLSRLSLFKGAIASKRS